MPDQRAFALKESVKDFAGGSVAVPTTDGIRSLNLKTRLGDDGVITTSDPLEAQALAGVPSLKEVPVPDKADQAKAGGKEADR